MKRISPGLFVVLAAAAAVHLAVAALDFGTLARNGFLYDDSFYAFQIARNIAQGVGVTFDGIHLTNGFQPLYVAVLVPIYWLAGDNPTLPIHIALVISALFTVATAFFLWRIVSRIASETAGLIVAAAWAFSPVVIRQSANGLETALALFCFALAVDYYLNRVRPDASPPRRAFIRLGVCLGLAVLARVDLGFLVLAMALDYLLVARSRIRAARGAIAWRSNFATTAAVCAIIVAPWAIYGLVSVGSPLPESGRATRYLGIAYAPFFGLGPAVPDSESPGPGFMARHVEHSLQTMKVMPAVHPVFRATRKLAARVGGGEAVANAVGVAVLLGFAAWWWRRRRVQPDTRSLDFLLVFAAVLVAAYSTYIFGVFFFMRYYYPLYFIGMVFIGLAVDDAIQWLRVRSLGVRRTALIASGAYASALLFMGYTSGFRTTQIYGFYDIARWVATHTEASETIGVFQSGTIGYLSNRRVVNLDGKVNEEAYEALRAGRLREYVASASIDLVVDSERVIDLLLGPWSPAERDRRVSEEVFLGSVPGTEGWVGYRTTPSRSFNAGAAGSSSRVQPNQRP